MRLDNDQESQNVEDRRGDGGGGGGGFGFGGRSIGIGTVVVALAASYFFGISPSVVLNALSGGGVSTQQREQTPGAPSQNHAIAQDEKTVFVRKVLGNTERTWQEVFQTQLQRNYTDPTLVIYSGQTQTACGTGQTAMGPFYCPADQRVYIDLSFYQQMRDQFGVGGDFAQAYVVAHEVGHHVQKLLGISDQVDRARARMSTVQANALSVRVELQADCFAGVWAAVAQRDNRQLIEPGEIQQGLQTAAAIGDDRLQQESGGRVMPDSFTHGTSEQRQRWLKRGLDSGDVRQCDTFAASAL
ncbi:zinc metallopeptidase [Robbsia sp. Bb-Pol-6]|uniref:Zinc metallopeptidase n=1 Tax=Robbsia betulipollinis TaxID=2981849 RepID=A0ABT3ZJ47_9BURK|nr:zinc metallopeptidase [Robbsia betulipollinis]